MALVAGNPVVTNTPISSVTHNATNTDIATALSNSIAANGETPITGNLQMNGFRHTGASVGLAVDDYATVAQVQSAGSTYGGTAGGTADVLTLTLSPAPASYTNLQFWFIVGASPNATTTPTINVNALGAKTMVRAGGGALAIGELQAGYLIRAVYDGTNFRVGIIGAGLGANTFTGLQKISTNATALPAAAAGTLLQLGSVDATATRLRLNSFASFGGVDYARANTSGAAPSALALDDTIGQFSWFGYGATGYSAAARTKLAGAAAEAWTDTAQGAYLEISTTPKLGTSTATVARFDDAGRLLMGVTANTNGGVLQLKSGITFPATQVSATDVNTQDDYEEGAITWAITIGGSTTGITYGTNNGGYTKVGDLVTVTGLIVLTSKGAQVGAVLITGLPFSSANTAGGYGAAALRVANITYLGTPSGYIDPNTAFLRLNQTTEAGVASALADTNLTNTSTFNITFSYKAPT